MDQKNALNKQALDSGLALTLIFMLLLYFTKKDIFLFCAVGALVFTMVWPAIYKHFAKIWFGFSHIIGTFMSRIILSLLFFLIITPMGLVRRLCGADPMNLRKWKLETDSVFKTRDHLFTRQDIEKPF